MKKIPIEIPPEMEEELEKTQRRLFPDKSLSEVCITALEEGLKLVDKKKAGE